MIGKLDRLKYVDHDTNDRGKFPQFAPGKYLHSVHYLEVGTALLEVKQWAVGLEQASLLKMLNVPHFGRSTQVTIVVKQLLALVHDGNLWIGNQCIPKSIRVPRDGTLVSLRGLLGRGP